MRAFLIIATLFLVVGCTQEKPTSDFDKFTGRWYLHIVETKQDSLSDWVESEGRYKGRKGFIMYDGLGGMGVHHVVGDYENYSFEGSGSLDSLSRNDLRHLADNFVYFGSYSIDDSLKIITHKIETANIPRMWGSSAQRKYNFNADTLTLTPISDGFPKLRLKWVRVEVGVD